MDKESLNYIKFVEAQLFGSVLLDGERYEVVDKWLDHETRTRFLVLSHPAGWALKVGHWDDEADRIELV